MGVPASSKIIELRDLVAAKFPSCAVKTSGFLTTGLGQIDAALHGGLAFGSMTEFSCPAGGGLFMQALIGATQRRSGFLALIDGANAFDPTDVAPAALSRLLWVRANHVVQAVQSADLLLRDGNLPLVVLDLRANPAPEVRKIPSTSWYRLQRVVEPSATAFVILTREPQISAARPRLSLHAHFSLDALEMRASDLLAQVQVNALRDNDERIPQYA